MPGVSSHEAPGISPLHTELLPMTSVFASETSLGDTFYNVYSGPTRIGGLAQTPAFWGLRSPEGTSLRQGIPESIFSGRMPFYKRTYSPGKLQFITTSLYREHRGNRRPPQTRSVPARE